MFRRGNPFVRARGETSSTHGVSHLRAGLSLSWPSHVHIQPNLLKSCHKIWRINQKQAKRTLEITSQHSHQANDPTLSRNYGMNDRMLRYK